MSCITDETLGSNPTILWIKQFIWWNRKENVSVFQQLFTEAGQKRGFCCFPSFIPKKSTFQWPALTTMSSFSSKALENTTHHTHYIPTAPHPHPHQLLHWLWHWECTVMALEVKTQGSLTCHSHTLSSTLGNSSVHIHTRDCYTLEGFGIWAISLNINTTSFLNHTLCNLVSKLYHQRIAFTEFLMKL